LDVKNEIQPFIALSSQSQSRILIDLTIDSERESNGDQGSQTASGNQGSIYANHENSDEDDGHDANSGLDSDDWESTLLRENSDERTMEYDEELWSIDEQERDEELDSISAREHSIDSDQEQEEREGEGSKTFPQTDKAADQ